MIHSGDFTMSGKPYEIKNFMKELNKINIPNKIVIAGNHDLTLDVKNFESNLKPRFYYKEEDKNLKINL